MAFAEEFDDAPEVTPSTQQVRGLETEGCEIPIRAGDFLQHNTRALQVASLINTLCNDTEIAEMHVKVIYCIGRYGFPLPLYACVEALRGH